MRWLLGLFLFLGLSFLAGHIFIKGYPYRLYSNWVNGEGWNRYYRMTNYRALYLAPVAPDEIPPYKEDFQQLWKPFPLANSLVPLPVRHPLFNNIPMVEMKSKGLPPQLGMSIHGANGRELSRIYTLPRSLTKDFSHGQELFKLPFVRNRLLKIGLDEIWKDVFTRVIVPDSKSMEEMIRDLYILHIRSRLLPAETIKYGLTEDGKAMVELASSDKDYSVELVMTQEGGSIYAYVLRTEKNNPESRKLRSKFLQSIAFMPTDTAMARLLYKEFKQLHFARQVDQEGMLYLFSAWSQDTDNSELLREAIFYLERGRSNTQQLRALYQFALSKYGKTFTTRSSASDSSDPELILQRNIELENIKRKQEAARAKVTEERILTPEEKMNLYLKKAKEGDPAKTEEMTVY